MVLGAKERFQMILYELRSLATDPGDAAGKAPGVGMRVLMRIINIWLPGSGCCSSKVIKS